MYKPVKDYEGCYEVNEFGEIRSVDRMVGGKSGSTWKRKGKKIKPQMDRGGYAVVILNKNGIRKAMKVHRLVCEAFLPNPENLPQIHHINHVRNDNRLENLRWVSRVEQFDNHLKAAISKANGIKVRVVGHGIDKTFISTHEAGRELGISHSYVSMVANGIRKQAKGYRIYFADQQTEANNA